LYAFCTPFVPFIPEALNAVFARASVFGIYVIKIGRQWALAIDNLKMPDTRGGQQGYAASFGGYVVGIITVSSPTPGGTNRWPADLSKS
jgi:hypothetical protein